MAEYYLQTPVSEEDIAKLNAGDTIYLSGIVFTARDEAHMELIEDKGIPGFDMTGLGLYHCGPVMKKEKMAGNGIGCDGTNNDPGAGGDADDVDVTVKGDDCDKGKEKSDCKPEGEEVWKVVSAGPTTSFRMETLEPDFLDLFNVKIIIGKGGMGPLTLAALEKHNVVYVSFTGGAGALAARGLGDVKDVYHLEKLGMPEAVWVFEAKEFGPLVVSMDAHGNSLYVDVNRKTKENLETVLRERGYD